MELILGVLDVAYSQQTVGGLSRTTTTGDVAEYLENQYHVMATYYELHKMEIATAIAESMKSALLDRVNGRTAGRHPMYNAEQAIEAGFRSFLDADEMSKIALALTGAPLSMAAARGVHHRFKHPYAKKNKARPAFIDTGLYRASFRASIASTP